MLVGVVGGEEEAARVELHEDAPDAPHVRRHGPAVAEDDFWGAVLPRVDEAALALVVVRGSAKVNDTDGCGRWHQHVASVARASDGVGLAEGLPLDQEDVLRLEVCVDELHAVKVGDGGEQLVRERLHAVQRQRAEVVGLDELVQRLAQRLRDNEKVLGPLERTVEADAQACAAAIPTVDVADDFRLNLCRLNVLGNRSDRLDCNEPAAVLVIAAQENTAERACSSLFDNFITLHDEVATPSQVVPLCVV